MELWVIGQSDTHSLQAKNKKVKTLFSLHQMKGDLDSRHYSQTLPSFECFSHMKISRCKE